MPGLPWKPLRIRFDLERQIDDAFRQLIHSHWGLLTPVKAWQPEIDVYETDDAYIVEADVPGVAHGDLRIEIDDHWVRISGARDTTGIERCAQGLKFERRHGAFSRRLYLSDAIDPDKVEHTCTEGLHRVELKKRIAPAV